MPNIEIIIMKYNDDDDISRWSYDACLGFLVKAMERNNYAKEEIKKMTDYVRAEFDNMTIDNALEYFFKSTY